MSEPALAELEKKLLEANTRTEELRDDRKKHAESNIELRDYRPFLDALKVLVEYPTLSSDTRKPSKIELAVREVHDKIQAEYKDDWKIYNSIHTTKREAIMAACDDARDAQIKLFAAKNASY